MGAADGDSVRAVRRSATILTAAILTASTGTWGAAQQPAPAPTPVILHTVVGPGGQVRTTGPNLAPSGVLVRYAGQLLDVERGFAYFTTGDGFRLDPEVKIVDASTGAPLATPPASRMYATATFDKGSGRIVQLSVSRTPIPQSADYDAAKAYKDVSAFAVTQSPTTPNNDVRPNGYKGPPLTGKGVAVTFVVQVPVTTPLSDSVYISTDVSNWDPKAILMQRIDATHYRSTATFASGTVFHYKYTRGSFRSIEVGENGLDDDPHTFRVLEADALRRDDIVYHWKDENLGTGDQTIGPGSIPTPYNPGTILNLPTPPPPFAPVTQPSFPSHYGPTPPPNNGQRRN